MDFVLCRCVKDQWPRFSISLPFAKSAASGVPHIAQWLWQTHTETCWCCHTLYDCIHFILFSQQVWWLGYLLLGRRTRTVYLADYTCKNRQWKSALWELNWCQTVLCQCCLAQEVIASHHTLVHTNVKISNTYLLHPCSFVTIHFHYLCSNPAHFDLAWTKQIPWRLCKCWQCQCFWQYIWQPATTAWADKRLVPSAENTRFTSAKPHPAISGYEIVSGLFFLTFDYQHFFVLPSSCHV